MLRRRIGFAVWLLCLIVLWLYRPGWLTVTALSATVLFAGFSCLTAFLGRGGLKLVIDAPDAVKKSRKKSFQITMTNSGKFPVFHCTSRVVCYNSLTREKQEFEAAFSAMPGEKSSYMCKLNSPYCGCLHVTAYPIRCLDLLGVFAFRKGSQENRDILLLPGMEETTAELMPGDQVTTKGSRSGEERFGVRDYAEGDPVNLMHWKLSVKLDKLMVRETIKQDSVFGCLFLETSMGRLAYENIAPEADARMETLLGISSFYTHRGIRHTIVYYDFEKEQFVQIPVLSPRDLDRARRQLMYVEFVPKGGDRAGREFVERSMEREFLHTLYVAGDKTHVGEWMDEQWITPVYRSQQ